MNVGYKRNMRCDECKYCRDVYTSPPQVKIRGCYCEPYKGKWVTEIENCGYEEKICDDLERKICPKCNAVMNEESEDKTSRK